MASGSFKRTIYTTSNDLVGIVTVTWKSTANANNTSTVDVTVTVDTTGTTLSHSVLAKRAATINCLGSSYNFTTGSGSGLVNTLGSKTFTIAHNADGTKNGTLSFYVAGFEIVIEDDEGIDHKYKINDFSVYNSISLDRITVAATISCEDDTLEMGQETTFTIGNTSTAYSYNVRYVFGAASGMIAEGASATVPWNTSRELARQLPNTTSGAATVYVDTYSNSTLIGSNSTTLTLTVPEDIVPSIEDVAMSDATGYRLKYGDVIKGKSTLTVNVEASGAYGSEITSCRITINGNTTAGTTATTNIVEAQNTIIVNVTDSRGRTATTTETETGLVYNNPTISLMKAYRCNSDGSANEEGEYIKAEFKAAITALNNKNSKLFKLEYRLHGAENWNPHSTWNTAYSVDSSAIIPADTDNSYEVLLSATDDFTTSTYSVPISSAFVLVDFNATGKGMAIGKVSESDIFDVGMEALFRKGIKTINGADLDALASDVAQIKATLGL